MKPVLPEPKTALARLRSSAPVLAALSAIPEETIWLEGQRSSRTRYAYRNDVAGFMAFLGIRSAEELRSAGRPAAVLAWVRHLEASEAKPVTIRRKLAALSSLYTHLVRHGLVPSNPCRDIPRPAVNRREGVTPAFSKEAARKLMDTPDPNALRGLRDRAMLNIGLRTGVRAAELVGLRVKDLGHDRGLDALSFVRKGGVRHSLALHPLAVEAVKAYLEASGHAADLGGPLFRPIERGKSVRRHLDVRRIARLVRRYAKKARIRGRYTAHSLRATFITTALDNGATLEEVQRAAGHASPDTTRLYDRRGFDPGKSASFFANY